MFRFTRDREAIGPTCARTRFFTNQVPGKFLDRMYFANAITTQTPRMLIYVYAEHVERAQCWTALCSDE